MYQKTIILLAVLLTSLRSCSSSYPFDPKYDTSMSPDVYLETNHLHGHITRNSHMKNRHGYGPASSPRAFNVKAFGAKANGNDDSQAFKKAWNAACSSTGTVYVVVPKNRAYTLKSVKFSGPCKSSLIVFKIYGKMEAWKDPSAYKERRLWIVFEAVNNLRVEGGGRIDGNGNKWWPNSCKINPSLPCLGAPTAVTFVECKNLMVSNIRLENAQQMHMTFQDCENVKALNLMVTSPANSPNTDGIHVTGTRNILIQNSIIRTGDDCISIVSGSENVRATGITCGPGHGISIGSLGANNSEAYVSNVVVNKATLIGTTNGVRIKTWQGGHGIAKNIIFQDIIMKNVTNPIIINQDYCDRVESCPQQKSAVQVSNVLYKNIQGTSSRPVAVKFECSESIPCRGISMENVKLVEQTQQDVVSTASCSNVKLDTRGNVSPLCT
ncbi:Polygalacturonase QRT2 [Raphanus sativus]|uniref:endo-polygalacturonase n=1 Tax=Raphanus sativus TaxID=3726 RepID=A0A6J0P337_RAPSA|nr:polygalacturonase QRT2 [Raphanus sativus]KAJ4893141.1 Polygalacturonase QRT2 [Raphanus sativus]